MVYYSPKSVSEALTLLSRWKGKGKLIAGGTNVLPELRLKTQKPASLIDLSHLKNLIYVQEEKEKIRVGGLTSISELADSTLIQKYGPILAEAARRLGNPLVRNRATIGGNLANASPAADTAVPLLVLDAVIVAERKGTRPRAIPIDRFFKGPNHTSLGKDEIIREVIFTKPKPSERMAYFKLGLRNSMAISVVSIAVLMEIEKDQCRTVRIGLGAVAPKPIRAYGTEEILNGKEITKERIEICREKIEKEVSPITDVRANAEYRRSMTSLLLKRLIQKMAQAEGK